MYIHFLSKFMKRPHDTFNPKTFLAYVIPVCDQVLAALIAFLIIWRAILTISSKLEEPPRL